jgi:hypothetical protein
MIQFPRSPAAVALCALGAPASAAVPCGLDVLPDGTSDPLNAITDIAGVTVGRTGILGNGHCTQSRDVAYSPAG